MIREIAAVNSLSGERQLVLCQGDNLVQVPDVPVTHQQVLQRADELASQSSDHLSIELISPMRLIQRGHLVRKGVSFSVLLHRLMERLSSLAARYSDTPLDLDWRALLPLADEVETVEDHTHWLELESYSTRKRGRTPIGGLVGRVTFGAEDWTLFLPWLVWGEVVHVGKDAVKGDGWYRIGESARRRISEAARQRGGEAARRRGS